MQITKQADYAVRAMVFLAKLEPDTAGCHKPDRGSAKDTPFIPCQDHLAALHLRLD